MAEGEDARLWKRCLAHRQQILPYPIGLRETHKRQREKIKKNEKMRHALTIHNFQYQ